MSQQDLSDQMEVTKSYINGLCKGRSTPSISQAKHIASIFCMKYSEFIALGED